MKPVLRWLLLGALAVGLFQPSDAASATRTLAVNLIGSGTVDRNPSLNAYPNDSTVTLTATPAQGWMFTGWSGDATGALNPTNVLMDADKVISANFSQIQDFALTVNITGSGSVTPFSGSFLSNTVVSLAATPSADWIFHQWSGDASGNANPLDVTMNSSKTISAIFVQPPLVSSEPSGGSADIGTSFSFSVTATGSAPITYQWFFNNLVVSNLRSWEIIETIESTTDGSISRTFPMTLEMAFYRLSIR